MVKDLAVGTPNLPKVFAPFIKITLFDHSFGVQCGNVVAGDGLHGFVIDGQLSARNVPGCDRHIAQLDMPGGQLVPGTAAIS